MTLQTNTKGTVSVAVHSHEQSSKSIPKQLQILRSNLSLQDSKWFTGKSLRTELPAGVYLIRLHLSSGQQMEEVVEIKAGRDTKVKFDISRYSPRESHEWAYFTKNTSERYPEKITLRDLSYSPKSFKGNVRGRMWRMIDARWKADPIDIINIQFLAKEGQTYDIENRAQREILEIRVPGHSSSFTCLPSGHEVKCLVKLADQRAGNGSVVDVSVATPNAKAEALLALMISGDMNRAKQLMEQTMDAEDLLYAKFSDTTSAAVGGYFLLRTGALERMHNWGKNLYNHFRWLPDGAIIHAWELIQKGVARNRLQETRKLFLEAVNRGIPIYTEGLRLLYEGLTMLLNEVGQNDEEVRRALAWARRYHNNADLSQETTTFIGIDPEQPGTDPLSPAGDLTQIRIPFNTNAR